MTRKFLKKSGVEGKAAVPLRREQTKRTVWALMV